MRLSRGILLMTVQASQVRSYVGKLMSSTYQLGVGPEYEGSELDTIVGEVILEDSTSASHAGVVSIDK